MRRAPRFAIPVLAALLFGVFALLYSEAPSLYFRILRGWGLDPLQFPFLDLHVVLAAIECKQLGYEVFVANPCDVLSRPLPYSPMILEAAIWPISATQTTATGITLSLAFFVALVSLPQPQGQFSWVITVLATMSTMTVFAVERGNLDLVIFIIGAAVGRLALCTGAARWLAYPLILFGAFLKFYPATLLILALREKPRVFAAITTGSFMLIALFGLFYRGPLAMALRNASFVGSYFQDLFGAVNLPYGLAVLLAPLADLYPATAPALALLPWALMALLMLYCLSVAIRSLHLMFAHIPAL